MFDALDIHQRLGLRTDWLGKLCHVLGCERSKPLELIQAVVAFQREHGITPSGVVGSQTRLKLEEVFDIGPRLLGPQLEEHCVFDESQTEEALHQRCEAIVHASFAQVYRLAHLPQMLAIRGVRRLGRAYWQTSSAQQFASSPYGERSHFSAAKPDYDDAVLALFWREPQRRVRLFSAVVNPASLWPEGTAHLIDGQYFYRIGKHRTYECAHIEAIRSMASSWPKTWIYDDSGDSIQYIALESTSPIEVVRSRVGTLDIDADDLKRAQIAIAQRQADYVDHLKIKINIHSSAFGQASSLGCQNIAPQDYQELMDILLEQAQKAKASLGMVPELPYTLIDASKLDAP